MHHITSLHWLPFDTQTQYKLTSLCYSNLPLLTTWVNYFKFTNQPASYILLLILPFFVFPLCACAHLVRYLFHMLHRLSGTVSHGKLGHQTHWHLSDHNYILLTLCVRVCTHAQVCMGLIPTKQNPRVWNIHTHIYRQTCPFTHTHLHPNIWMRLSPKRELLVHLVNFACRVLLCRD